MDQKLAHNSSNHNLIGFVPALVIEYLLQKLKRGDTRKLPEKQAFNSVVMFADISGFTNLSEKLSKKGSEGAELLAFTLNRYMELLVTAIARSGKKKQKKQLMIYYY
jgi:class 3 adenylate cyclase